MMLSLYVLTVQLDQAVGLAQRVLGHALVRPEVLRRQIPDLEDHVLVVPAVRGHGLVFLA